MQRFKLYLAQAHLLWFLLGHFPSSLLRGFAVLLHSLYGHNVSLDIGSHPHQPVECLCHLIKIKHSRANESNGCLLAKCLIKKIIQNQICDTTKSMFPYLEKK